MYTRDKMLRDHLERRMLTTSWRRWSRIRANKLGGFDHLDHLDHLSTKEGIGSKEYYCLEVYRKQVVEVVEVVNLGLQDPALQGTDSRKVLAGRHSARYNSVTIATQEFP